MAIRSDVRKLYVAEMKRIARPGARGRAITRHAGGAMRRLLLGLILAAPLAVAARGPWVVEGRVVGVSDGDTITVLDRARAQHVVRLGGIDAPERRQPFGTVAKENLSRIVYDRLVEARCWKRDRYGREVCSVYLGTRDAGLEMIRDGFAWHFKEYQLEQSPQEREEYARTEEAARAARRGLWGEAGAVPPWEWRKAQKK
jgi:endonuclease YncB( thermonuclease family)